MDTHRVDAQACGEARLFCVRHVLERRDHCVFDRRQPCPIGHLGRDTEAYLVEAPREMGRNAMALRDGNFGVRHGSMMARVRLISK